MPVGRSRFLRRRFGARIGDRHLELGLTDSHRRAVLQLRKEYPLRVDLEAVLAILVVDRVAEHLALDRGVNSRDALVAQPYLAARLSADLELLLPGLEDLAPFRPADHGQRDRAGT